MPSKTEPQARFFAACSHGAGYSSCPPMSVSREFNQADKGSALLSNAMKHKATGGSMSPLAAIAGDPMRMRSSMPKMGVGTAHMKMPRIPIADTLRNINQSMKPAKSQLQMLKARGGKTKTRYDVGGEVRLGAQAINAVKTALSHLRNRDASSAAAVLRSSPQALAHPSVAEAAQGLRASTGIAPATKALTDVVNAHTDATVMPTFRRGGRSSDAR